MNSSTRGTHQPASRAGIFSRLSTLATLVTTVALAACADAPITQPLPDDSPRMAVGNANNGMTPLDDQYVDDQLCAANGFDVLITVTGWVKVTSTRTRKDGTTRVVEVVPNSRITLAANGKSLTGILGGTAHYVLDAGGALEQVTYFGMNGVFTVPGEGRVAAETGKLVLAADGTVLVERGPHDVFGSSPNVARLCAALAP